MMISPGGFFFFFIFNKILIFQSVARAKGQKKKKQNEKYPHKKISEILLLHSGIIVVLSNKY